MKNKENNYAFIDSQNLHKSIEACGWKLDFTRFRVYLRDKYHVSSAYLFIGYLPGNESLYTLLQRAGYIVIFKPTLEYKKDGVVRTKGNVDAELVLHCMIQYPNYDKAILVSGDGDFHCLIEYLEEQKKLAKLLIPDKKRYSALLRRFIPHIEYLNELAHKLGGKNTK
ncbi:MAG: hypothetical protein G01um101433_785 [Parcubacteria group bacterium Gr01-1014_33]|nr:MAG: hypothetical protein G01um101433_785 [Parcubacteria group bacterium Gr01-1014_33]